jgi:hypothetical protein
MSRYHTGLVFLLFLLAPLAAAATTPFLGPDLQPHFMAIMDRVNMEGALGADVTITGIKIEPKRVVMNLSTADEDLEFVLTLSTLEQAPGDSLFMITAPDEVPLHLVEGLRKELIDEFGRPEAQKTARSGGQDQAQFKSHTRSLLSVAGFILITFLSLAMLARRPEEEEA